MFESKFQNFEIIKLNLNEICKKIKQDGFLVDCF
jgi:hypothetical protein